jgi:hypothetical protein
MKNPASDIGLHLQSYSYVYFCPILSQTVTFQNGAPNGTIANNKHGFC